MIIQVHKPTGIEEREATVKELKEMAKQGSIPAIRELVKAKGKFSNFSRERKDRVIELILGYDVDLQIYRGERDTVNY